ncbi:hypothetical protein [Streptomyces sp. ADI98-10]|uniref:hypothetical protein n=1 Tax=Streptomyces sp. ADI98-10 TaxID=1522763 RepID=UPI000F5544FC|nr:hypothetical protein [Streptomyces sp. ADI98-10]RPK85100.1 hypothetical protein EES46_23440 [Streptomyces sp. ADI98-10]
MKSLQSSDGTRQATPGQAEPATAPTVDHIIGAPLAQLLNEHNARIVEITSITDHRFFGQLFAKTSGEIILAMPAGQDSKVRDVAARILFAHYNDLPLGRFPNIMTVTDVVKNGVDVL